MSSVSFPCLVGLLSRLLPELRGDLLDRLVLGLRHLQLDVQHEQSLDHDEDDEDVRLNPQLKNVNI